MPYLVLITLHSWFRWVVVVSTLALGARCALRRKQKRSWTRTDTTCGRLWIGAIDIQVTLGLLLYVLVHPSVGFFRISHPASMLLATAAAHAAWVWTRRADEGAPIRFRRLGLGIAGAIALILVAIPWPFLFYGRPLFRL